MMETKTASRRD